jgi:transposase-like protein
MITAEMRAQMRRLVLVDGWRIETVSRRFGVHHSVVRRALREELDCVFRSNVNTYSGAT